MYELNDLLREWAHRNRRVINDEALDNAVHAVNELLPRKRRSRRNLITRQEDGRHIVTDGVHTYVADSFDEAKVVMDICHGEDLSVDGFIALYCEQ